MSCWTGLPGGGSSCAWPCSHQAAAAAAFLDDLRTRFGGELGLAPCTLADRLPGASYAELEQFAQDVRRRYVLALPDGDLTAIAKSRLNQWRTQAHR